MQNRIFPMIQALKRESNVTRTENGAKTLRSTGAATLDLFATIGALRNAEDADIIRRFERAWAEDHDVALSLGIYFAEHNTGAFHNHFITFSMNPRLIEIKGDDLVDKVWYCCSYNECANTNVQKVFELILEAALKNHLPQSELPETLYFISDMEFDCCSRDASLTNFEYAKTLYGSYGYKLPKIVFWNVQTLSEQQPVKLNEQGVRHQEYFQWSGRINLIHMTTCCRCLVQSGTRKSLHRNSFVEREAAAYDEVAVRAVKVAGSG